MSIKLMQLVWDADVPQSRKLVLLSLADQANDAGECYPRISTIERRCSMGRRTVFQCLSDLESEGFLTRTEMSNQRVLFRIDERLLRQLTLDGCGSSTGAKSAPVQKQHQCENGTGAVETPTGADSAPDRCEISTRPVRDLHPYKATPIEPKGNPNRTPNPQGGAHALESADGEVEQLTAGQVVIALRRKHRHLRINAMNPQLIAAVSAGTPLSQFLAMAEAYPDMSAGYIIAAALSQFLQGDAPEPGQPAPKPGRRGGKQTGEALRQSNRSVAAEWLEQAGGDAR
jgi:Fe2+ or Zn2+ uptake regulation protein